MSGFKDHFSDKSAAYSQYRPGYPTELFEYLASKVERRGRAWDCATGNGQSAINLANYFQEVIATDASKNQIDNAKKHAKIKYRVESAEKSTIQTNSVDLVTVAQAVHWFDLEAFTVEIQRVLKPNGLLAIWTYGLFSIQKDIDTLLYELYAHTLDNYWPPERNLVEEGYKSIQFPFQEIDVPKFTLFTEWKVDQVVGYLKTWSAVKKYESVNGNNPVDDRLAELQKSWPSCNSTQTVAWPITMRVWKKQ